MKPLFGHILLPFNIIVNTLLRIPTIRKGNLGSLIYSNR